MVVTVMAIVTIVHPMSASAKITSRLFAKNTLQDINGILQIVITDATVQAIAMNARPIPANVPA
jgi:hypothetical protein